MADWVDDYLQRVVEKITVEMQHLDGKTPYIPYDGRYSDVVAERGVDWWTNGFWGGLLWQVYSATKRQSFLETAIIQEKRLNQALATFNDIHHDVGFMWLLTAVAHYRVTGNQQAYRTGLHAANLLAGRFNIEGQFLVAWNDHPGWVIIDSMMNIQLLYWASQQTGDPRFEKIATHHADTVAQYLVREDGSVGHIASFDADTGQFIELLAGQGVSPNSAWSRGNAWAIYGFALTYRQTRNPKYLRLAEKIAQYFSHQIEQSDNIPLADFRAPTEPRLHDTSAGMIAACGFLELSLWVDSKQAAEYIITAQKILQSTVQKYANWGDEEDGIIGGGTEAYHRPATYEVPLIYADYFFIEALLRLKKKALFIW